MKVGDLVMYNLGPDGAPEENHKDVAIVVAERTPDEYFGVRNFRMYYPHYNDYLNGWEDEFRVIS